MNKLASTQFRKVPFFQLILLAKSYKIAWFIVLHSRNCPTSIHPTLTRRNVLLQMNDTSYRGKMYRLSSGLCNPQHVSTNHYSGFWLNNLTDSVNSITISGSLGLSLRMINVAKLISPSSSITEVVSKVKSIFRLYILNQCSNNRLLMLCFPSPVSLPLPLQDKGNFH